MKARVRTGRACRAQSCSSMATGPTSTSSRDFCGPEERHDTTSKLSIIDTHLLDSAHYITISISIASKPKYSSSSPDRMIMRSYLYSSR